MIFQLTRSVGSVTLAADFSPFFRTISTHTLRGERDSLIRVIVIKCHISTHTLRGERDVWALNEKTGEFDFNSHAPWGA